MIDEQKLGPCTRIAPTPFIGVGRKIGRKIFQNIWEYFRKNSINIYVSYTIQNIHPANKLMFDWTGWLSEGATFPANTPDIVRQAAKDWGRDGLHMMEFLIRQSMIQVLFRTSPEISPVLFASRVKGRLQYSFRTSGMPVVFSRKISVRSLGENTRTDVENYIRDQVQRGDFADPRFAERMKRYTVVRDDVDLAQPFAAERGRYWYNLHLVLTVAGRYRMGEDAALSRLRDEAFVLASRQRYLIKTLSLMPDHIHTALRGNIEQSPLEIGVAFQNHLAGIVGLRLWQESFYVGSFGEYGVRALLK
jgi:REP element-mobilizing transposase RayT